MRTHSQRCTLPSRGAGTLSPRHPGRGAVLRRIALAGLIALAGAPARGRAEEDIEPLPVPKWIEACYVKTFTPPATEEGLRKAAAEGLQAASNVPGLDGFPWYDGERFYYLLPHEPRSAARPIDFTAARRPVERCHAAGIKVIGVMPPMWEFQVLDEHRDWQRLTAPDAKPIDPYTRWPPGMGCWVSPFGDWYIRKNVELVRAMGWDGQCIDGFGTYTLCYCRYCREAYSRAAGRPGAPVEVPSRMDPGDPNFRRFLRWRLDAWSRYVSRWTRDLKAVDPEFAFVPWSTGPGRWWHWSFLPNVEGSELGNLMIDAPMVELFWDFPPDMGTNLLPSFTTRFYRGFCRERPVWMHTYFRSQGQQNSVTPRTESEFRVLTVLTNGGVPPLASYFVDEETPEAHYYDLILKRREWLFRATSLKWAALLVSESSRLFYGIQGSRGESGGPVLGSGVDSVDVSKLPPGERRLPAHLEAALGAFRAALEAHLPLDIISEADIERGDRLGLYRVVILPDAACVSDRAAASLRRFVEGGGGLVATQGSSLLDETGDRRPDFALADLFGARFRSFEDHTARWPEYPSTAEVRLSDHPVVADPAIRRSFARGQTTVNFIGRTVDTEAAAEGDVVAWYSPCVDWAVKPEIRRPFLTLSSRGKGRVAYFAAAVDQSYFASPYPYERPLLVNAVRWAAGADPRVSVVAPMCVQATFYEQREKRRTIVHLLNEIDSTGSRALPESNPPVREEVVPIAGIWVRFDDADVRRVSLEPEGLELKPVRLGSGIVQVEVPRLGLHSMVVAER